MLLPAKTNEQKPSSLPGQVEYIFGHLAHTAEAGPFMEVEGYLDQAFQVKPLLSHPDLFSRVGWDGSGPLPPSLVRGLLHGQDLHGNQLSHPRPGGHGVQLGKEIIIPFPSELSELLYRQPPQIAYAIVTEVFRELVGLIDDQAVRVRVGHGEQEWREAQCLTLGYPHFMNHLGEPEVHLHDWTFAPALDPAGQWRTRDSAAFLRDLQGRRLDLDLAAEVSGRRALTDRMVEACRAQGIDVDLSYRFASQMGRAPHGATVSVPGLVIAAGETKTERHAQIVAAQHAKAILGVQAPTRIELRRLLSHPGQPLGALPGKPSKALLSKLYTLGLVDENDRLLPDDGLRQALASVASRLEVAEVHLDACTSLPGSFVGAQKVIQERRSELLDALGMPIRSPSPEAITTWHEDYLSALAWAGRPGPAPPQDPDRPSWVLLRNLRTAGFISPKPSGERDGYRLTDAGRTRLQRASMAGPSLVAAERSGLGARLAGGSGPRIHRVEEGRVGQQQAGASDPGPQGGRRDEVSARAPGRWLGMGVGTPVPDARPAVEDWLSHGLHRGLATGDLWGEDRRFQGRPGPLADPGRCSPDHAHAGAARLFDAGAPTWQGHSEGIQGGHRTHAWPLSHPGTGLSHGSSSGSSGKPASASPGRTSVLVSASGPGGDRRRTRLHAATTGGRELLDSSGSRSPYHIRAAVLERPQLRIGSLPSWLTAMLDSPLAEYDARRMLRGRGGLNAGVVGGVPGWEPTPSQRWNQDQANTPKAPSAANPSGQQPSFRPRLP